MAPPIYDGAPIVHKHYSPDGELVGWTEIESPWDEDARAEAEALYEAERLECPMCGSPLEDCGDPDRDWYPQRHICYATRQRAAADRLYGELHKDKPYSDKLMKRWSEKATPETAFHYGDGVRIWEASFDVNPDDDFLKRDSLGSAARRRRGAS